ncbi:DUF2726 domain-containing protein [Neisseria iguanae]|uniref:DUF2726 domain-containing protein n=1 Tax=Neisseria iguanae TaxID=90242 RepID=A0A2P7TYM9_9NEIS|nr:DUF2726 domain-containing protein [Neisseria iguanae]PSJ79805.1 hypothetical protein C7N83_10015 [Neisseria iguanae]
METIIILGIIIVIFAVIGGEKKRQRTHRNRENGAGIPDKWPFYTSSLMSAPEQQLYWKLKKALPDHLIAFQVQTSRVLKVKKGHNFGTWHNRINRMSYDFVVCNKNSYPIAVIELDDSSHERDEARIETDKKKNKATTDAGLKIYRWKVNETPSHEEIKALFNGKQ